ncbi:hypothetical protein ACNFIA_18335 [Pseudomonas sp. NY15437]|uniref:hypothetical protein n=1 Tax=Pseudomonas sp. NY15437 TaxID=3400360 RepID=UPI003A8C7C98
MTKTQRPKLSDTVDGVLFGWKHQAQSHSATFAKICPGPTFTLMADGKLHKVVAAHLTAEVTPREEQELRDAIAAGQVEIYRLEAGTKRKVIMHQATGLPLQSEVNS